MSPDGCTLSADSLLKYLAAQLFGRHGICTADGHAQACEGESCTRELAQVTHIRSMLTARC